MSILLVTSSIQEFFNDCHAKTDGQFCSTGKGAPKLSESSAVGFRNQLRKDGHDVASVSKHTSRSWKIKMGDGTSHVVSGGGSLDKLPSKKSGGGATAPVATPAPSKVVKVPVKAAQPAAAPTATSTLSPERVAAQELIKLGYQGAKKVGKHKEYLKAYESEEKLAEADRKAKLTGWQSEAKARTKGAKDLVDTEAKFSFRDLMTIEFKDRGPNAKPKIATESELDALVAGGGIQVFRGLSSSSGAGSADKFADEFRQGDAPQFSDGLSGSGYYSTPDKDLASSFARIGGTSEFKQVGEGRGNVVRMVIKSDAKVISWEQAQSLSQVLEYGAKDEFDRKTPFTFDPKVKTPDERVTAAAKSAGYDVVVRPDTISGDPYYVVLNRGSIAMSETNHAPE